MAEEGMAKVVVVVGAVMVAAAAAAVVEVAMAILAILADTEVALQGAVGGVEAAEVI